MILGEIEDAKRAAERARRRFDVTLASAQARLHPNALAEEAWDGVKGKGAEIADTAVEAVKSRPVAVTATLGAVALFLARGPLKRAAARLISGDDEEGSNAEDRS
ncbi:DUF3618 domain-containing protein [Sphingosinicella sp. LHD-64]|uniref:DUF3618 domain-containing protein n=1 Tax=Sphingosinicella sp. LHD-64 TaxID=3072139 RepID=UPI00280F4F39|nr:DUF3618 domain-containing protein [Sphingosinicella sp. LHD-64]MDQ8757742.1 DUF3618 domain-containing protein [Sphingosinicella sp. LHD-64]